MKLLPLISNDPFNVYMEVPKTGGEELLTVELVFLRGKITSFDYWFVFNHLYLSREDA